MPGRTSGEVMLALKHQEAKSKEKEQEISCKFQVASCELRVKKPSKTGLGFWVWGPANRNGWQINNYRCYGGLYPDNGFSKTYCVIVP
jgi:hypothetical protein